MIICVYAVNLILYGIYHFIVFGAMLVMYCNLILFLTIEYSFMSMWRICFIDDKGPFIKTKIVINTDVIILVLIVKKRCMKPMGYWIYLVDSSNNMNDNEDVLVLRRRRNGDNAHGHVKV